MLALLLAVTSAPARADGLIVPFIGYNFGGDSGGDCLSLTNCKEKRTNYGVSLVSMGPVFGLEEDLSYAKNFFGDTPGQGNSVFSAMTNFMVGIGTGTGTAVCCWRGLGWFARMSRRSPGRSQAWAIEIATPSGTTSARA